MNKQYTALMENSTTPFYVKVLWVLGNAKKPMTIKQIADKMYDLGENSMSDCFDSKDYMWKKISSALNGRYSENKNLNKSNTFFKIKLFEAVGVERNRYDDAWNSLYHLNSFGKEAFEYRFPTTKKCCGKCSQKTVPVASPKAVAAVKKLNVATLSEDGQIWVNDKTLALLVKSIMKILTK